VLLVLLVLLMILVLLFLLVLVVLGAADTAGVVAGIAGAVAAVGAALSNPSAVRFAFALLGFGSGSALTGSMCGSDTLECKDLLNFLMPWASSKLRKTMTASSKGCRNAIFRSISTFMFRKKK
jgi:hypothetical protein